MNINGLQKMTLLDYPGHVACTVFLGGCDFRCPYCHNYDLACGRVPSVMDDTELLRFLSKRQGLLDGVAVTGGEPCLHDGLPDLLSQIRSLGFGIKLDTNGYHPEMLSRILDRSYADYVAMDIKNSPEKYAATTGTASVDMERIRSSIRLLMESGTEYEFRTTVVREFHEAEDFEKIGCMIEGASRYFLQPFTDRDSVPFANLCAPDKESLEHFLKIASRHVKEAAIRGL